MESGRRRPHAAEPSDEAEVGGVSTVSEDSDSDDEVDDDAEDEEERGGGAVAGDDGGRTSLNETGLKTPIYGMTSKRRW